MVEPNKNPAGIYRSDLNNGWKRLKNCVELNSRPVGSTKDKSNVVPARYLSLLTPSAVEGSRFLGSSNAETPKDIDL